MCPAARSRVDEDLRLRRRGLERELRDEAVGLGAGHRLSDVLLVLDVLLDHSKQCAAHRGCEVTVRPERWKAALEPRETRREARGRSSPSWSSRADGCHIADGPPQARARGLASPRVLSARPDAPRLPPEGSSSGASPRHEPGAPSDTRHRGTCTKRRCSDCSCTPRGYASSRGIQHVVT